MIFVTYDTKGQWYKRFNKRVFPQQKNLTKEDYVMVVGCFGVMNNCDEWMQLDWLDEQPFTTLFLASELDSYEYLNSLPVEEWHGGKVCFVRPSIIYLHSGQVYDLDGIKLWILGDTGRRKEGDGNANSHKIMDDYAGNT